VALAANWGIGVLSILLFDTGELIIISAMAAVLLYILSMESLVRLRNVEPDLPHPYRIPFCPWTPRLAQILAGLILAAMLWENTSRSAPWSSTTIKFLACLGIAMAYFFAIISPRMRTSGTAPGVDGAPS
jgi:amino acid transporter